MNDKNSNLLKVIDPRFNEELYGFNNIEKLFLNILKNDKLLNAYIFYGIKGVGKATFAFRLARFILNQEKNSDDSLFISKENKVFKSIASLSHPDFIFIYGDSSEKKISTELLKTIQINAYKTSVESKYKVILLDSIDDISTSNSSNVLLKLLEDCPKNCIFLMISHSIFKVSKTIRSRCQNIYFKPINNKKFKNWFTQSKIIENKNIDIILSLSNGSLGRAMEIINTKNYFDIYHKVNKFIQNIETIENSDVEKLFSLYNSNEISVENFLLIIQFHITKVIKILTVKNNQNNLIHCYLSLFFKINEIISSFKSFKLDQNQLLNIIKSILLNHSKNYN